MTFQSVRNVRPARAWTRLLPMVLVLAAGAALLGQPGSEKETPPKPATAQPGATSAATDASQPGADAKGTKLPSLVDLFNYSPMVNGAIIGFSVVAVVLFIFLMLSINVRSMMPPVFLDEVTKLTIARRFDEAANFCRNQRHVFAASILQRCFENVDKDPSHLLNLIDAEGRRRSELIWNRVSYLTDVSSVAPMLGLLGTVLGMLEAFFGLSITAKGLGSTVLAQSIGGAMTATFLGILVAIIAVVFHSIIKSRTVATLSEVELVVHSIADHIHRK